MTEVPGLEISRIQLARDVHRYGVAAQLAAGRDVLDAACGAGQGLGVLARSARRVVGGDYTPHHVRIAREHYGDRVGLLELDAQALPFEDASFDLVLLLEALYYLPEPHRFAREARRVLRTNGRLLVSSVNCAWPDFSPSPLSRRYFDSVQLVALLRDAGFEVELTGAFPDERTLRSRLRSTIRRAAIKFDLIPGSLGAKAKLKRFFYGPLLRQPKELEIPTGGIEPVTRLDPQIRDTTFSTLYAVGRTG